MPGGSESAPTPKQKHRHHVSEVHRVITFVMGQTRDRSSAAAAGVLPMRLNRHSARPPSHRPLSVILSPHAGGSARQGAPTDPCMSGNRSCSSRNALSRPRCSSRVAAASPPCLSSCALLAAEESSSQRTVHAGADIGTALAGVAEGACFRAALAVRLGPEAKARPGSRRDSA